LTITTDNSNQYNIAIKTCKENGKPDKDQSSFITQANRMSAYFLNYPFNRKQKTRNRPSHEDFMDYNNSLNKLFLFKKRSRSCPDLLP
jgi:hypothetical protein